MEIERNILKEKGGSRGEGRMGWGEGGDINKKVVEHILTELYPGGRL